MYLRISLSANLATLTLRPPLLADVAASKRMRLPVR